MRRLLVPLAILALAAGCGGSVDRPDSPPAAAPSVARLVHDSAHGRPGKRSAHYELDAKVELKTKGGSSSLRRSLIEGQPVSAHVSGDASRRAFTADGHVSIGGMTFSGQLLAGSNGAYVNLLGTWYGADRATLGQLGGVETALTPAQVAQLDRHADELVRGTVSDGPTLDGVDTWELDATLDPDALVRVVRQAGKAVTAGERQAVDVIADATTFTVDVGKNDHLVRRFHVGFDLSADRVERLGVSDGGIESVKVSVTVDLSRWGERVAISPPSRYQPLAPLLSRFLELPRRVADY